MFTGLVEIVASVDQIRSEPPGRRITIRQPEIAEHVAVGDSVAVDGCCLTVVDQDSQKVSFQAGPETLARTTLGDSDSGVVVNLERSLRVGDRLGGHYVTGHIDDVGVLDAHTIEGEWSTMWFRVAPEITRQLASKGSVAVNGVSLTLVDVENERFSVALIPHTLSATNLGVLKVGDRANVETDLLAKYVERQLQFERASQGT